MSLFVLDTDHLTIYYHGDPIVVQRVDSRAPTELAISVLTVYEQLTRETLGSGLFLFSGLTPRRRTALEDVKPVPGERQRRPRLAVDNQHRPGQFDRFQ
jgi:hypothetical protein